MIVLLVGPSGAGKTTLYQRVEPRFPDVIFRNLDGLATTYAVERGWIDRNDVQALRGWAKNDDHFLAVGLMAIADLSARNPAKHLVVDVGAGFQQASYATRLQHHFKVITIHVPLEVIYRRLWIRDQEHGATSRRSREVLQAHEYTPHREAVYARCDHFINNADRPVNETADELADALKGLFTNEGNS